MIGAVLGIGRFCHGTSNVITLLNSIADCTDTVLGDLSTEQMDEYIDEINGEII